MYLEGGLCKPKETLANPCGMGLSPQNRGARRLPEQHTPKARYFSDNISPSRNPPPAARIDSGRCTMAAPGDGITQIGELDGYP